MISVASMQRYIHSPDFAPMENELRAPHAGRVAAVRVAEGDRVELGAVLLVLEPPSDPEPAGNSDSG